MVFKLSSHPDFVRLLGHVATIQKDVLRLARMQQTHADHTAKILEMFKHTEARILVLEGASGLTEEELKQGYGLALERMDEVAKDIQAAKEPPPFNESDFGEPTNE